MVQPPCCWVLWNKCFEGVRILYPLSPLFVISVIKGSKSSFYFLNLLNKINLLIVFLYCFRVRMFCIFLCKCKWLLLILQTNDETSADEWETECRRVKTNERRVKTNEGQVQTNERRVQANERQVQTNERQVQTNERQVQTNERLSADDWRRVKTNERPVQVSEDEWETSADEWDTKRTLVHLRDDSRCLRAFTLLNIITDLMFKTSSLFPYFGYFGPYSR